MNCNKEMMKHEIINPLKSVYKMLNAEIVMK